MKETKSRIKSNIVTGMSSSVGATIGMVVGSAFSTEANAVEPEPPTIDPNKPEREVIPSEPTHDNNQTEPVEQIETPIISSDEPNVSVLSYETVTNEDGSPMDVAIVSVDGQQTIIADIDMDGTADVIASDLNANGLLDNTELIDVTGQGITMAPFQDVNVIDEHPIIAQNEDYVNNADVNDYMA